MLLRQNPQSYHFLKEKLKTIYSNLKFKNHHFNYMSTIDIDSAYAYKGKKMQYEEIRFSSYLVITRSKYLKLCFPPEMIIFQRDFMRKLLKIHVNLITCFNLLLISQVSHQPRYA